MRRLLAELVPAETSINRLDEDTLEVGSLFIGLSNLRARWDQLEPTERAPWLRQTLPTLVQPPRDPHPTRHHPAAAARVSGPGRCSRRPAWPT